MNSRMSVVARFTGSALILFLAPATYGGFITISNMNADTNLQLEGTLGGTSVDGSSTFVIDSTPSTAASATTSAQYTVSNVDIDDDNIFGESFVFRIDFSSLSGNGINFISTLEEMGIDGESSDNETIDNGESFTMSYVILSDTSATHDVIFDGVTAIDFVSMTGTDVDVTSTSGNETVTLVAGNTELSAPRYNPTFTFDGPGGGTFEDWNIQFSTASASVPEPSSLALLGVALGSLCVGRRRRLKFGIS